MSMMGIMSGRLSPPIENKIQAFPYHNWREEFPLAKEMGFECVEWIFEIPNMEINPICTDSGIAEMRRLSEQNGVKIASMVADNFMFERLFGNDEAEIRRAEDRLIFLIQQAHKAGISILELPLMGYASVREKHTQNQVVNNLQQALQLAEKFNVMLSLELDLPPDDFRYLLNEISHPYIGVNYDMGNSAMFGFDHVQEIAMLGEFIVNVHIKDGIQGGGTVPLGSGDTNFHGVLNALKNANYTGDYIFQAAREDISNNHDKRSVKETLSRYVNFIHPYL